MIASFRSKGPKGLFETGKSKRVRQDLIARLLRRVDALHAAKSLGALNVPGFDFHALRGKPQRYSTHVNGPWAITFGWENDQPIDVDLEQYH